MKFPKLWPKDATSIGEKILYAAFAILVPAAFLFMQLSAWGIFHNIYSTNVAKAAAGWHVLGFTLSVTAVFWYLEVASEKQNIVKDATGAVVIIVVLAVLALLSYAGFVFNG